MSRKFKVAVIVGSLSRDSINRKVANALVELAPASLNAEIVEIGHLPLYDRDTDLNPPEIWKSFRSRIASCDAVLFVTPEHNSSIPGALKNAIDGAAQIHGESVWKSMPGAVVSASPTEIDCVGSSFHLRQTLVHLNVPAMARAEDSIGCASGIFDAKGKIADDARIFLQKFMRAFEDWVSAKCVR
jgi:chromate reductase